MKVGAFFRNNILIIAGLGLPALVMIIFMVSTMIPTKIENPPKYSLVFAIQDYSSGNQTPISVNFVVKDGILYAQYTKNANSSYYYWKKLYLYDAKTEKIKQLSFGLPTNIDKIEGVQEAVVESTQGLKLDTTLQSPDGYQLLQQCNTRPTGLFGELFIGSRYNYPCLKKGGTDIRLMGKAEKNYYYPGSIQFIGWVIS
ncbi:hypothetical protein [Legionella sp. W05-934-2]|jgi:hypothetical protein|uniref:hypothetical protein n=1 Tax=Legionella sp. W05-934-2 TaxID=1198649 RepID=UPI0034628030